LPKAFARRRELARGYIEGLANLPGITVPTEPAWARSNWQSFCVRLSDRLDQVRVMQQLLDEGISTRRGIMCAHREQSYGPGTWTCDPAHAASCECAGGSCRRLAESERAQDHGVILPLFHQMTDGDQARVITALRSVCVP
jgi:perosamine synthetase